MKNDIFLLAFVTYRKMTSTESGNGIGSKSSVVKSNRQMFVAPRALARGCGKKLHELYASKS